MNVRKLDNNAESTLFEGIAQMHKDQLSAGILADLGLSFLVKLYQALVRHADSAVYIVQQDTQLIAFAACTTNNYVFHKYFIKNNIWLIIRILPKLFAPALVSRSISMFKHLVKQPRELAPKAELLSIVVTPATHRNGLGRMLMSMVFNFMQEKDITQFKVIAADTQYEAQSFYISMGGKLTSRIELGNLASNVYHFSIKMRD